MQRRGINYTSTNKTVLRPRQRKIMRTEVDFTIKNSNDHKFTLEGVSPSHQQYHEQSPERSVVIGLYDEEDNGFKVLSKSYPYLLLMEMDSVPVYILSSNKNDTGDYLKRFIPKHKTSKPRKTEESYQLKMLNKQFDTTYSKDGWAVIEGEEYDTVHKGVFVRIADALESIDRKIN